MLEKKVLDVINKNQLIEPGDNVVVGLSGGPDSVCLLHILHTLADGLNIKLFAVHVNHMLRGEESDGDEQYVTGLCGGLGIPLQVERIDIQRKAHEEGISLEEAGREARYRVFETAADRLGTSKIAVAHNRSDQVETVLMRLIRGTGPEGLAGMDWVRGRIIRPLLEIEREEIEKYCLEHSLGPRTDSSNLESVYTRNRIRIELLPSIKRLFNADISGNIYRLSSLIKQDMDFIDAWAAETYGQCLIKNSEDEVSLDAEKLLGLHPAIRTRVVRQGVKSVKGDLKGLEYNHVESVLKLAQAGRTGSEIHLPCGIRAGFSYGALSIHREKEGQAPFEKIVAIPGNTEVEMPEGLLEAELMEREASGCSPDKPDQSAMIQFFDYDTVKSGINIRNRREGDLFKPYGSNGTKKLKEFFIDSKIPRDLRDKIPLIATKNEILWIIGFKSSDKFKVTENTKRVLKLKYNPKV